MKIECSVQRALPVGASTAAWKYKELEGRKTRPDVIYLGPPIRLSYF